MTGKHWIIIPSLFALGAALLFQGPPFPVAAGPVGTDGIRGAGGSGLQIVNMDPDQVASVSIDLFPQRGGPPVTIQRSIAALGTGNVYLPIEASLAAGAYSAIARSDRPIDVFLRHDWARSGSAVVENRGGIGTELILPLVVKAYNGQTSVISIQNTSTQTAAHATLTFFLGGQVTPAFTRSIDIGPGASVTIDMGRAPEVAAIPAGSLGWMRLTGDQPLAMSSMVDLETSVGGVYSVEGGPLSEVTGAMLSAALVANDFAGAAGGGSQTTGISVLNPGDESTSVLLRYAGAAGSCAGMQMQHGPFEVPAKGMVVFYQGNARGLPTGDSGLPVGCAASALIEAGAPVAAVVNSYFPLGESTAAVLARPLDQGAVRSALPVLRRRHTNLAINSLVQVHNPGPLPAQVELRVVLQRGQTIDCAVDCKRLIPAGGAAQFDLANMVGVPDNSYGSAWLLSDQPVFTAVLETGSLDSVMYNGLPDRGGQEGDAARTRALPLLLRGADFRDSGPTQTAEPSEGPGTTPTPAWTPAPRPIGSLFDLKAGSGVQLLNFGAGPADASLRLQDNGGGDPTILQQSAVPSNSVTNFYLPSQPSLNNGYYSGMASAQGQSVDAIFRSDWQTSGKSVMGRAPTSDVDLIVPLVARHDGITSSYLFVQNSDTDQAATVTLDLRVAEGQRAGRRRLRLSLAAGAATMIDMSRHPALQDLIPDRSSWTGWVHLSSDRPIAATALSDVEGSAGAYSVPGLADSERSTQLAAPMLYRRMPENEGQSSSGFLDSAIHVLNPRDEPVTVTVRYTVSSGNPAACPAGREVVHGGQSLVLAPGEIKVYHQRLPTGGDSGLPDGCAASARIEASAPVVAVVNVSNDLGLVAAYPAYPVALASAALQLPLVRREHTGLKLTTLIQVQNPGDRPVTVNLRYTYGYNSRAADCPSACTVTLAAGASHTWDPRQIATWLPNSYGSARIEADGPVTAVVLDDSTVHLVDLAAYSAPWDSGRQVAPLPLLSKDASLGSLTQPDLELATLPILGIAMRPPTAKGDQLTTQVDLRCGSQALRRVVLRFVYDAGWLRFDTSDGDGDGVPDAVAAAMPGGAKLTVMDERRGGEGRLTVTIDAGPAGMISGALRLAVTLRQTGAPGEGAFGFGIDPKNGAEMTAADGQQILPEIAGMGWRPGAYHEVYLPVLAFVQSMASR